MEDKRKKKLLVTASTFPRWKDDTEPRFVLDLASHMTDEFDVTVLVPAAPGAKNREVLEGVEVIRYHYFPVHKWETLCYPGAIVPRIKEKKIRALLVPFLLLSLYFHLWKILPEYDVVHAHWLIPQGIVQSFFKKPYIVTGHGGDVVSLNKGIIKKLKMKCLRKAGRVTVVSEYLKKRVQELVPEIEPEVISMGVDTRKFGRQYRVENYFGQGDKKVVLFVGRLAEKKGVAYLIEAMKQIDALLVIVGNGPLRKTLEEQAEQVGKDRIRFLGEKTHEELKKIYASADIFVAPSVTAKDGDQEGLGLVLLEAMASGLPVVASKSGGITQIIKDGENGLLCEEKCVWQLAENICALLNDECLYKKIAENGNRTVKAYDYVQTTEKYMQIINHM
ncbi:glycosyltransferase family 4 protein [bacterium 0.1xD8-71]|nr:glycosyltransferase family 4 protein [bacterium 0.1xD8-71]